jgi:hypothetical protein
MNELPSGENATSNIFPFPHWATIERFSILSAAMSSIASLWGVPINTGFAFDVIIGGVGVLVFLGVEVLGKPELVGLGRGV